MHSKELDTVVEQTAKRTVRRVAAISRQATRKITALLGSGNVSIQRGNVLTEAEQDEKRQKLLAYPF